MVQRPPTGRPIRSWDGVPVKQAGTQHGVAPGGIMKRGCGRACGALGLAAARVGVLAACGSAKFNYVDNGAENTYIRVPTEWKVFTVEGGGARPDAFPDSVESVWHVAFDASDKPSLENTAAIDALLAASVDKPVGQLQIFNVQGTSTRSCRSPRPAARRSASIRSACPTT